jgi:hypothetical protein
VYRLADLPRSITWDEVRRIMDVVVRGARNFIDNQLHHCQRKSGIPQCGI